MVKDYKGLVSNQGSHLNIDKGSRVRPKSGKDLKKVLLFWGLLILGICFILINLQSGKAEIFVTQYGRLTDEFVGQGLIVRAEEVVYAPFSGTVKFLVQGNERVPLSVPILELTGAQGQKTFYSTSSGVVSWTVDGLENNLNPDVIFDLQQDFQTFKGKSMSLKDEDRVNAGRPLYRIIDNFKLYFLVKVPSDQVFRYSKGNTVWVTFDGLTLVGWVRKIYNQQELFVIEMERFPKEVIDRRLVDVQVLADAETGVYVPRQALVYQDDEVGVYLVFDKKLIFKPVILKSGDREKIVVEGLARGVEILANPKRDLAKFPQEK